MAASRFRFRGEGGLPARPGEGRGRQAAPPLYKMAEALALAGRGSPGQRAASGSPALPRPRALKLVIKATCTTPRRF